MQSTIIKKDDIVLYGSEAAIVLSVVNTNLVKVRLINSEKIITTTISAIKTIKKTNEEKEREERKEKELSDLNKLLRHQYRFKFVDTPSDGNCLFSSMAYFLYGMINEQSRVRKATYDYMVCGLEYT